MPILRSICTKLTNLENMQKSYMYVLFEVTGHKNIGMYNHYITVDTMIYSSFWSKYEDFLFRGSILTSKLLSQGYYTHKPLTTFCDCHVHEFDISMFDV